MKRTSKGASAPASTNTVAPKQRCKKGDLAIVLSSGPWSGAIVDIVEYFGTVTLTGGEVYFDAWRVRHATDEPGTRYFEEDRYLLPIRPGDLDETVTDELSLVKGEST